jgi:hypothetical protein
MIPSGAAGDAVSWTNLGHSQPHIPAECDLQNKSTRLHMHARAHTHTYTHVYLSRMRRGMSSKFSLV